MVCVDESNKEIKKPNWGYIGFEFLLPLHFFKSEVWELIKFQSSQPEYFLPSHLAPTYSLALRSECLQHPTRKSGLHTSPPRPPLMTCAFYTKTVIQNPLCRLMFTLCHCLERNLLLRVRFAFKICLRHQSVTPILDPSLTVTDISSRNGCSYYW